MNNMASNKKIALILPTNIWFCPYASIYMNVLDRIGVNYDIISWNRRDTKENAIQYNYAPKSRNPLILLWAFYRYTSFVKKTIKENGYERLIVFSPQLAIYICDFLRDNYKNRYIFDYRDLSIEQKYYFKERFKKVLENSYANVISSPGFKQFLPKGFDYLLSHNFNVDDVRNAVEDFSDFKIRTNPIDVLTIGGIRDYSSNVQVIENLANEDGFSIRFVGKGPSAEDLRRRVEELKAKNVSFEGYYPKEKEKDYVSEASFLNIFYPRCPSHDSAISNRFYNSLIYRKPMIVTKDTIQGNYAEKYYVGVAIENCDCLSKVLRTYLASIDTKQFCESSNRLLKDFLKDYDVWEKKLLEFIN